MINGEMKWTESAITHLQLKSFVARVTRAGEHLQGARRDPQRRHADQVGRSARSTRVRGSPRRSIRRPRRKNTAGSSSPTRWNGATPGEHTLVSRVTDATGKVQPTEKELENKKTFLEDNSQHPRRFVV